MHFTVCIHWCFFSPNHFTKSFWAEAPSACIYIFSTLRIFRVFVDCICNICVYEDQGFLVEPLHFGVSDPSPGPPFFKCAATAALLFCTAAVSFSSWPPQFLFYPPVSITSTDLWSSHTSHRSPKYISRRCPHSCCSPSFFPYCDSLT